MWPGTAVQLRFWNFKDMRHRLFCFHMTGALIDGLAAIGVFSFLAFSFLPEWEETKATAWDDSSMCQNFFDYQATGHEITPRVSQDISCTAGDEQLQAFRMECPRICLSILSCCLR